MSTGDPEPGGAEFSRQSWLLGARRMLPLTPSVLAISVVFGALARQAGMSIFESAVMSTFVYAGAAQFVAVGLWSSPLPVATIIPSTFILNLRHVLMGATLRGWLNPVSPRRTLAAIAALADESWALTTGYIAGGGRDRAFLAGAGLALTLPWVAGTVVGQLAGARLPDPTRWGLDVAFTAALIGLLVPLWRGKIDLLPWTAAGVVSILWALRHRRSRRPCRRSPARC